MLDLSEGLLDGVQVWGVWGQEPEAGAGSLDTVAHGLGFVGAEVVGDDNIARLEGRQEQLLDIGQEALAVDWAVEDARSCKSVAAQGGQESHGAPVPMGCKAPQAFILWSPSAQWGHVGLDPGLVDEDEALWIDTSLPSLPAPALAGNVSAALFKSEQRFF